jgi:hypothetical protein
MELQKLVDDFIRHISLERNLSLLRTPSER